MGIDANRTPVHTRPYPVTMASPGLSLRSISNPVRVGCAHRLNSRKLPGSTRRSIRSLADEHFLPLREACQSPSAPRQAHIYSSASPVLLIFVVRLSYYLSPVAKAFCNLHRYLRYGSYNGMLSCFLKLISTVLPSSSLKVLIIFERVVSFGCI